MKKGVSEGGKEGFTIIETSLVLAIAGLIFLMIFVALPALMRLQRDSQRKDDITTMLSKLKKYQTNNRGALPEGASGDVEWTSGDTIQGSWANFYQTYLGEEFVDPSGMQYKLAIRECGSNTDKACVVTPGDTMDYTIYIIKGAMCSGERAIGAKNIRKVAALYRLEGGGIACLNT